MKIPYILYSLTLLCIASACSLDKEPLDTYSDITEGVASDTIQSAFKDKSAVLSFRQTLLDLYKDGQEHWYLDMLLLGDTHADNAYAGAPGAETTPFEVNSIEGSNTNLKRDWNNHMGNVAQANKMINNIDAVRDPSLSDAEKRQYKAEAKILRAMIYFDMVRIWGSVPLVTQEAGDITSETITDVYSAYFPPQTDELTVYNQIEEDLLDGLMDAPENNPADKRIFSKSVARALLAKMYAEKPLRDYDKVIQYADELEADGFDLVDNFSDLFSVVLEDPGTAPSGSNKAIEAVARNTKETIFEAQFFPGNGNWVTWMYGRPLEDWNSNFTWAKWITPSRNLIQAFNNSPGDKRLEESIVYYSCDWNIYYPAEHYPFMYKCRSAYNSIIKIRYADILLLKAEALIGQDNLDEAVKIINRIRKRAGLGNLPASATAGKETLLNAYLKERRLELAFEGQRWFDLVRLDKVEEVLNSTDSQDEGRPPLVYPYSELSYQLPIPQDVIDQNPNLVQNPGY